MFSAEHLNRLYLSFIATALLIHDPAFAVATVDETEIPSTSETRKIFTPSRKRKRSNFHISPASKELSYAIYLIHDSEEQFNKIDFNSTIVSASLFHEKISPLRDQVEALRRDGKLNQFHRYVGLVSVNTVSSRRALSRFREHATVCNSTTNSSEKRLCLGLKLNSREGRDNKMSVLAYNIHPSQINALEAHFIKLFGGLEDLGWNSNPGDLGAKYKFDHPEIDSDSEDEWLSRLSPAAGYRR